MSMGGVFFHYDDSSYSMENEWSGDGQGCTRTGFILRKIIVIVERSTTML